MKKYSGECNKWDNKQDEKLDKKAVWMPKELFTYRHFNNSKPLCSVYCIRNISRNYKTCCTCRLVCSHWCGKELWNGLYLSPWFSPCRLYCRYALYGTWVLDVVPADCSVRFGTVGNYETNCTWVLDIVPADWFVLYRKIPVGNYEMDCTWVLDVVPADWFVLYTKYR